MTKVNHQRSAKARVFQQTVRPFDIRYAYFTNVPSIWNRCRPELWDHCQIDNLFLTSRKAKSGEPEGPPFCFTKLLGDDHALRTDAYFYPTWFSGPLLGKRVHANVSTGVKAYLKSLRLPDPDEDRSTAESVWLHALAIGFSPSYLAENADGLAIDWPRVPLPVTNEALISSTALGRRLAALLDTDGKVPSVTSGSIAEHYRVLGGISASDLKVNAGWGRADKKGSVYPGTGKIVARNWSGGECGALKAGFDAAKIPEARGFELLGRPVDVYLNGTTYWRAVPEQVWEFYIGGYQVVKKWLSYREEPLIGRPLTKEEAREVTGMVHRLAAILLMTDELDANYVAVREHTYSWPNPT